MIIIALLVLTLIGRLTFLQVARHNYYSICRRATACVWIRSLPVAG